MEKRTDWKSKNQGGDKQKQKSNLYRAPRRTAEEEENDKAREPYRALLHRGQLDPSVGFLTTRFEI